MYWLCKPFTITATDTMLDDPIISDYDFDQKLRELADLEKQYLSF